MSLSDLSMFHLLRRNLVSLGPHVNFLIDVNTGNDEEHAGTPRSSREQASKSEDDSSLIFLKGVSLICLDSTGSFAIGGLFLKGPKPTPC